MKKVCYVIPVYNSELTISNSLLSIHSNKYDLEVIVINDNSTDNSENIIQKIKNDLTYKLHVITNNKNLGISTSLNIGIEMAISINADYILRLDSDDFNTKGRTDFQVDFMENNQNIIVCSSNAKLLRGKALKSSFLNRSKSIFENQFRPFSSLIGSIDFHPTFCLSIKPFKDHGIRYGKLPELFKNDIFIRDGIEDLLLINLIIYYYGIHSIYRHAHKELITYRLNDKSLTPSTRIIKKKLLKIILIANQVIYKVNFKETSKLIVFYKLSLAISKHHYKNRFSRIVCTTFGMMILYINSSNYLYKLLVFPIMIFIIPRLIIQYLKITD